MTKVLFLPEVVDQFLEIAEVLYNQGYFGYREYAIEYSEQLFKDIPSSFDDEVIKYLYKLSEMFNFTKEEMDEYKKSLKMNWDLKNIEDYAREKGYKAGHAEGHADGRAEGRVEGELAAKISTAEKLIAMGIPLDVISEATGLTLEELSQM